MGGQMGKSPLLASVNSRFSELITQVHCNQPATKKSGCTTIVTITDSEQILQ